MRLFLLSSIFALILSLQIGNAVTISHLYALAGLFISLLLLGFIYVYIFKRNNVPYSQAQYVSMWLVLLGVFSSVVLSFIYSHYWLEHRLQSRLPSDYSSVNVTGVADVNKCDYTKPGVEKYELTLLTISPDSHPINKLRKISVSRYLNISEYKNISASPQSEAGKNKHHLSCGFRVSFSAKLRAPYSFINPVGFDYEGWLLSKGIDATGYLTEFVIHDYPPSLTYQLINVRQKAIERAASLPGFSGRVVPALLFGVSGYLGKKHWSNLQVTGAIHLLVVSGLHVGLFVLIMVFMWRKFIQLDILIFSSPHSVLLKLTPLVLVITSLLYVYLAGVGLAVQRASLMLIFSIIMVYYKSHWSIFDTWLWVMWMVLMLNPLASLSIGFWFSFAAVGCLLLSYYGAYSASYTGSNFGNNDQVLKKPHWVHAGFRYLREWLSAFIRPQWIVFIALMPLLWIFHQSQSILSLLVNTLAIPLLAVCILPLSILSLIFGEGIFTTILNWVLTLGFDYLNALAIQTSWLMYKPSGEWLFSVILFVIAALMFNGFPFKRLGLLLLCIIYFLPLQNTDNKFVVLDVGQGLSVMGIVSTGANPLEPALRASSGGNIINASWVYDTGARFRSGFSLGETVVAQNILSSSGNKLNVLFVSHSDNDHAGGEDGLRKKVEIGAVYAGQPTKKDHRDCHQLNNKWQLTHGLKWRVFSLSQTRVISLTDNNQSCVVQFEIHGVRILLPGDIEEKIEKRLVNEYGDALNSDVLIVPHHGSKTSSSLSFIQHVMPKIAVISSGFNNPFHHPHDRVVDRFRSLGIDVYNTVESGAVEIDLINDLEVTEWRKLNPPVWRQ